MVGIYVDQTCWEFESTSLPKYVESNFNKPIELMN